MDFRYSKLIVHVTNAHILNAYNQTTNTLCYIYFKHFYVSIGKKIISLENADKKFKGGYFLY